MFTIKGRGCITHQFILETNSVAFYDPISFWVAPNASHGCDHFCRQTCRQNIWIYYGFSIVKALFWPWMVAFLVLLQKGRERPSNEKKQQVNAPSSNNRLYIPLVISTIRDFQDSSVGSGVDLEYGGRGFESAVWGKIFFQLKTTHEFSVRSAEVENYCFPRFITLCIALQNL